RLVEKEQHRISGEGARDLDDALLAERQATRCIVEMCGQPHARDRARGLGTRAGFLGAVERKRCTDDACTPHQICARRAVVVHTRTLHTSTTTAAQLPVRRRSDGGVAVGAAFVSVVGVAPTTAPQALPAPPTTAMKRYSIP